MQTVSSEKIFELICSLDRNQLRLLEKEFKGDAKNLGVRLYRRLRKLNRWGKDSEAFVKGLELQNTGQYWRTKRHLTERMVRTLMTKGSSLPVIEFIRTAIQLDLVPVAKEYSTREVERAIQNGDEKYLRLLLEYFDEFERIYQIDLRLEFKNPEFYEVQRSASLKGQLLDILGQIRKAFKQNQDERDILAAQIEEKVKGIKFGFPSVELLKVRIGIALLRRQTKKAIIHQKALLEVLMDDVEGHPLSLIGSEITIYIRFMMFTYNYSEAIKYTRILTQLPKGTPIENRIIGNLSLSTQIVVSEFLADLELVEEAGIRLLSASKINPSVFAGMVIRIAVCYFYHGKFVVAEKWMSEFLKIPQKDTIQLDWEFKIFSAMLHLENRNDVLAESFLFSALRKGRKNNSKYQEKASEILLKVVTKKDPWSKLYDALPELNNLLESYTEKEFAWLIDIRPYIQWKMGDGEMAELVRKSRRIPYTINILGRLH